MSIGDEGITILLFNMWNFLPKQNKKHKTCSNKQTVVLLVCFRLPLDEVVHVFY